MVTGCDANPVRERTALPNRTNLDGLANRDRTSRSCLKTRTAASPSPQSGLLMERKSSSASTPGTIEIEHPSNKVYVISAQGTDVQLVNDSDDFKRQFEWSK